jgi:DNA-directed RNA polymerase I subunit RPA43
MSHSKPSSTRKPTDFHDLTARLKLPLAPVFLTKPMSKTTIELKEEEESVKEEMDDLESDSDGSTKDGKKPVVEGDKIAEEYGNSGVLEAVNQSLASLMMKYIPSLGSVLVSYLEPPIVILKDPQDGGAEIRRPATKTSRLSVPTLPGNAWGLVEVEVKLLGWRPTIGQKLVGRPTLASPSHLSLVIYRTFNASINENHLRAAGFHYDINFEVPAHWKSIVQPANPQDQSSLSTNLTLEHQDRGCWVDANGVAVGDDEGTVSFTVMGYLIQYV